MDDLTPIGSQENILSSQAASVANGDEPNSSPVLPQLRKDHGSKPRKPPTITPRSFTRFFTPKSSLERGGRIGTSRQALRDITASASNRRGRRTPTKDTIQTFKEDLEDTDGMRNGKRRKIVASIDTTPDRSSPLKRIRNQSLDIAEDDETDVDSVISNIEPEEHLRCFGGKRGSKAGPSTKPITGSQYHHGLGRDLRREIGTCGRITESSSACIASSKDWQYETSNFFTRPEDSFVSMNVAAPSEYTNPFCTASCNSKSSIRSRIQRLLMEIIKPTLLSPLEMKMVVFRYWKARGATSLAFRKHTSHSRHIKMPSSTSRSHLMICCWQRHQGTRPPRSSTCRLSVHHTSWKDMSRR